MKIYAIRIRPSLHYLDVQQIASNILTTFVQDLAKHYKSSLLHVLNSARSFVSPAGALSMSPEIAADKREDFHSPLMHTI